MPPIDPQMLAMLMQLLPEYSVSKEAYMPADVGSQASQMNLLQDMMQVGSNPLFAGLAPGGFDPRAFEDVIDEQASTPAVTQGRDNLQRIIDNYGQSTDGMLAQLIMDGNAPRDAVNALVDKGLIQVGEIPQKDGTTKPDYSERDYYLKRADQWHGDFIKDRDGVEVKKPSPALQAYLDAGFTDPRQQYTNSYIDPNVDRNTAATTNAMDIYKAAVDKYKTADSRAANIGSRPTQTVSAPALPQPVALPPLRTNDQGYETRLPDVGDDPAAWLKASEELSNAQAANEAAAEAAKKAQYEGMKQEIAAAVQGAANRGVRRGAPDTTRQRNQGGVNSAKTAMTRAMHDAVNSRVAAGKSNAKANAQADFAARTGRTPFLDQMAQRQAMLRAMGLGS